VPFLRFPESWPGGRPIRTEDPDERAGCLGLRYAYDAAAYSYDALCRVLVQRSVSWLQGSQSSLCSHRKSLIRGHAYI